MKLTFGIDPGHDGGIACIPGIAKSEVAALVWNDDGLDVLGLRRFIDDTLDVWGPCEPLIVIEKVHAMPKQGTVSMFTFGAGFGELKAVAKFCQIPWALVPPQTWKKSVLAGTDKSKGATVAWAHRTYPALVSALTKKSGLPHMGKVDALAIAHYGHYFHAR